jgi:hypothetical protein
MTSISEGPTCQVRGATLDYLFRFGGRDKHAPPIIRLEGPACQVRGATLDYLFRFARRDKHAPPSGHDRCALAV